MDDSDYEDYDCGCDFYDDDDDYDDYDDFHGGEYDSYDSYQDEEEENEEEMIEDLEEEEVVADEEEEEEDEEEALVEEREVEATEDEVEEELEEEEGEELAEGDEQEEEEVMEEEEEVDGEEDYDEDGTDYEDEIVVAAPLYVPRPAVAAPSPAISSPLLAGPAFPAPRHLNTGSGSLNLGGDGGVGCQGSDRRGSESGHGMASARRTNNDVKESDGKVDESRGIESEGNESNRTGFEGPICPICYERWDGEGEHCVCCLPCGHLYGLSCIKMWLQRPNSETCPQCNEACNLEDVRRLFGVQLAATGDEELQQKVKALEAKCAFLELKDADWLKKEAEWRKREADLQQQLNQHKEAGLVKDIMIQGDTSETDMEAGDWQHQASLFPRSPTAASFLAPAFKVVPPLTR